MQKNSDFRQKRHPLALQRTSFGILLSVLPKLYTAYTWSVFCKWEDVNPIGWHVVLCKGFPRLGSQGQIHPFAFVWDRTSGGLEDSMHVRQGSGGVRIQVLGWGGLLRLLHGTLTERPTWSGHSRLPPSLPCPRPAAGRSRHGQRNFIHPGGVSDQVLNRDLL